MNIKTCKVFIERFGYFPLYAIAAIILFIPVINKYFVSDDFTVLKRVCLDGSILIHGFFRPLSDVSIYLNYLVAGLRPSGFNLVNILLHSFNSCLLFKLCCKWNWTSDLNKQRRFSFMASVLFLTYPFHNEAVVWLLGRGSSLAATFCIFSLLIFFSSWKNGVKCFSICICYFLGLLAYESIIILPALICILLYIKEVPRRAYFQWGGALLLTLVAHFLIRYKLSTTIFGSYGENLLKAPWMNYPLNILKVVARLIIPPIHNTSLFITVSVLLIFAIAVLLLLSYNRSVKKITATPILLSLLSILGCTLIMPFLFGVSTKTSESDRLLYLPSIFLCCSISYFVNRWIKLPAGKLVVFACVCMYNIFFLELNNVNWLRAAKTTLSILQTLKSDTSSRIFIVNLPNEINGAYVYREGFMSALVINNVDTARISIINKLTKDLVADPDEIWTPVYHKGMIFIPPQVQIFTNGKPYPGNEPGVINYSIPPENKLYYWDQHQFMLLKTPLPN